MVLVDGLRRLDFRPATHPLAVDPTPVAQWHLAGPSRRRRLLSWRDVLLHLDDDAVHRVDPPPARTHAPEPGAWTGVGGVFPALEGAPLVLGRDGAVRWWAADGPSGAPLLELASPWGEVELAGLGGGLLHVRAYDAATTELHDLTAGELRWRRDAGSLGLVPVGDAVLEADLTDRRVVRLTALADGAERWRTTAPGPVRAIVAVVGGTAWVAVTGHGLFAIDVATGATSGRLDAPYADTHTPTVAPDGRAVWTTGHDVVVVDLVRGVLDAHVAFAGPGQAAAGGGLLRCSVDGRLAFSDIARQVWLAEPGDFAHPHVVHRTDATITGLEIHRRGLYVLTEDGTLTVLG